MPRVEEFSSRDVIEYRPAHKRNMKTPDGHFAPKRSVNTPPAIPPKTIDMASGKRRSPTASAET